MHVLLTGGAGYIGSHTCIALLNAGHEVTVLDNFSNSSPEAIKRVEKITGKKVSVYEGDCCSSGTVDHVLRSESIDAAVHFAGYKAVGESVRIPLSYYENNLNSALTLCKCMNRYGIKGIVFSSSATVYGEENQPPYREDMPRGKCTNPYGWTKAMIEQILQDLSVSDPEWSVVLLRYFNPIGAHESGLIGEDPSGIPNNLMPYICQTASGLREKLQIFGNDYPTPDGTCIRDYIHVMDLAEGHVKALEYTADHRGCEVFNLGTGEGYSVYQMIRAFEETNGLILCKEDAPRRPGDLPESYADVSKAESVLGWHARRSLQDMCRDSWNWQKKNPSGYSS